MSDTGENDSEDSATTAPETPPLPAFPGPIIPRYQRSSTTAELQRIPRPFLLRRESEGHPSGGYRGRTVPSVASKELVHLKERIQDSPGKCRSRVKMFSQSISKADEFVADKSSKKRICCDLLSSERSGVNLQKMGNRLHGSRQDLQNQKMEQRSKNTGLAKHPRTSAADGQANNKLSTLPRHPTRVPAGGDKKIRIKGPVRSVGDRAMNDDVDPKKALDSKVSSGSKLGSFESSGFRSNSWKGEQRSCSPGLLIHGKISSAQKTGSIMALDSSTNLDPSHDTFQDSEKSPNADEVRATDVAMEKIHAIRQLKWVGKRLCKKHPRSNLLHPFAAHSDIQNSLQEFSLTTKSDCKLDDHEASVATADSTSNALNQAWSHRVRKKTESNFASVVNDHKESFVPGFTFPEEQRQLMSGNNRVIVMALPSIHWCPEQLPHAARAEELISDDTHQELTGKPNQKVTRKRRRLRKLGETILRGQEMDGRRVEGMATSNDAKMVNKRRMALRGTSSTKTSSYRVENQVASDFTEQTPARRKELRGTGISGSREPRDAKSADCVGSRTAHYTMNEASKLVSEAKDSGTISGSTEALGSRDKNISRQDSNLPGSSKVRSALGINSTAISEHKAKTKTTWQRQKGRSARGGLSGSRGTASLRVTVTSTRPTEAAAATNVPHHSNKELARGVVIDPVKSALDGNLDQDPRLSLKFDLDGVLPCYTAGLEEPPWDDFLGMMTP